MEYLTIGLLAAIFVAALLLLWLAVSARRRESAQLAAVKALSAGQEESYKQLTQELRFTRQELLQSTQSQVRSMAESLAELQKQIASLQDKRLADLTSQLNLRHELLQRAVSDNMKQLDSQLQSLTLLSEQKLDGIRSTVSGRLDALREDNRAQLEQMRQTVDEKLQKTLEDRISQSFRMVSERLEQVYRGLGEMQSLAAGVGDLKKVLSNVKTRGVLGEIQLGAILEQILSPEQYETNVATKRGSQAFVEYAVKLPGDGEAPVYLPIDAKFPADAYVQLTDAYDHGDPSKIAEASAALERRIRSFAKDIHDKYIDPPGTTDFAILFLPFEGLYAEVVRKGMVEQLQRDYKVNIAGPTTMAALLNSLQMGFKTLSIQKRSGEVWRILGAVKTEFDKFGDVLQATQLRLEQANTELDRLVGVRTRKIQQSLKDVTRLGERESEQLLEVDEADSFPPPNQGTVSESEAVR